MGLTRSPLLAVAERRAAVVVPGHFEYTGMGRDPFDPQSWTERAIRRGQIRDEGFDDDLTEAGLLPGRQFLPISFEAGQRLEGRHNSSAEPSESRCVNMSSADWWTVPRPAAMSSSASCSPASHSGVKNQAWSVGMDTKPRTVTVPSSWRENSTSSPSPMCSARLMSSGSVSCALARTLALALTRGCGSALAAGTPITAVLT